MPPSQGQRGTLPAEEDPSLTLSLPEWLPTPWEDLERNELHILHAVLLGTKKMETLSLKEKKTCVQELSHWKQYSETYVDNLRKRLSSLEHWMKLDASAQHRIYTAASESKRGATIATPTTAPHTPNQKTHRTRIHTPRSDDYHHDGRHRHIKRQRSDDESIDTDRREQHDDKIQVKLEKAFQTPALPMYHHPQLKQPIPSVSSQHIAGQHRPPEPKPRASNKQRRQSSGKAARANDPSVQTRTSVHQDVTQQRIAHQTPITTFWSAVEPYFRQLNDEDIAWINQSNEMQQDPSPFMLPLLGRHYASIWAEEDGLGVDHAHMWYEQKKEEEKEEEKQAMQQQQPALLPLAERVIAALIDEQLISSPVSMATDDHQSVGDGPTERSRADLVALEERIRRELVYIGVLEQGENIDWSVREDDELAAELRYLQRQLRQQLSSNQLRREALLKTVAPRLDYQHYQQKLQDIEKQLEQAYVKRFKLHKNKVKRQTSSGEPLDQVHRLLQMREDFIRKYSGRFPKDQLNVTCSIFDQLENEEKKENIDSLEK